MPSHLRYTRHGNGWKELCDWCEQPAMYKTSRLTRFEYSCREHHAEHCSTSNDIQVSYRPAGFTTIG